MAKNNFVYVLNDETEFEGGTRKTWSTRAYELCSDAFDQIIREILALRKEKRDIKWSIAFDQCRHNVIVIKGEGEFPSEFDEDLLQPVEGVRTYTLQVTYAL